MDIIFNKIFLQHDTGEHVENKHRLDKFLYLKETEILNGEEFLGLVHTKEYLQTVKKYCQNELPLDPDTVTSKNSYKVACYAVGAAILASEKNAFALVRPPGHHATSNRAMGFCLFNNIAIVSQYLVNKGKKVLIIDFDCHYGNGTAEIFYNTDDVLYFSTHQYPAYPGTGWIDEIGNGNGRGYNICVPLPSNTGDDMVVEVYNDFLPKLKKEFKPDVVAVSAGFDAHHSDPITQMNFSMNTFYEIGKIIKENFDNVFACLEGGYHLGFLHKNIYSFLDGFKGDKPRFSEDKTFTEPYTKSEALKRIEGLKKILEGYWGL